MAMQVAFVVAMHERGLQAAPAVVAGFSARKCMLTATASLVCKCSWTETRC